MKPLFAILTALFFGTLTLSSIAQSSGLQQQEAKQQQIQEATARASTQIAGLISEFERNGITGPDVDILTGIQSVLGQLSAKQMTEIVQLLGDARNAAPEATSTKIVSAYTGQKAVIVQLRQVLLEYQRQLALDEIARLIRELGDRQSTNLHEALSVLSATQRQDNNPNTSQKISVQLQASEQSSIRDETAQILKRLESIPTTANDDRPERGVIFITDSKLNPTLDLAARELEAGKLMSAAGSEKSARDSLWQLADLLRSQKDKTNELLEASAQLQQLIKDEQQVIAQTEKLNQKPLIPGEENIAQDPRVQRAQANLKEAIDKSTLQKIRDEEGLKKVEQERVNEIARATQEVETAKQEGKQELILRKEENLQRITQRRNEQVEKYQENNRKGQENGERWVANSQQQFNQATEAARRDLKLPSPQEASEQYAFDTQKLQGEIVDKTDFLKSQLESLLPAATNQLAESVNSMQQARASLGSNQSLADKRAATLPAAQNALTNLQLALDTVLAQLEKDEQIASELEPDTEGATQPDKAEQLADLLDQVKDLQAKQENLQAQPEQQQAPQAALENLTSQTQQQAAPVAPEAASDLADAAEQMQAAAEQIAAKQSPTLEQQAAIDALAQAAEKIQAELAAIEAAKTEFAANQDILDKLNPIIKEQQDLQTDTNQSAPDSQALAEQQSDLQEKTAQLGQEAKLRAVSEAAKSQSQASQALTQNQPKNAQQPQAEALANLNAAKDTLEQRQNELAEALGQPPSPATDLDALEQAIAAAQSQVTEGLEQLAADQTTQATTPLAAASDTISPFTSGTEGALPSGVEEALENAQKALAESTAQASAAAAAPAQASAEAAQQALAQASAALTLAQAGLSPPSPSEQQASNEPGEKPGEGDQPGPPKEGNKPGEKPGPANGDEPNWADNNGTGDQKNTTGTSKFIGLPDRERGTIRQGTADSYPAEYSSMIEQYLKNLSDQSSGK